MYYFIMKTINEINSKFNLNIQFNYDNDKELIPILPDINIDKTENYLKSLNKKLIFFIISQALLDLTNILILILC